MQAIRPFIKPVFTATIGAMAGYCAVKQMVCKKNIDDPNFKQFLSVVAGIGIPVCFGLSTIPAFITSTLISGVGTYLFGDDDDDVTEEKSSPNKSQQNKGNTSNIIVPTSPKLPKNIQNIVDAFSKSFENSGQFGKQISDEFTKNFNALPTPDEKIECIQGIFTAFKKSSYTGVFNNSEIWTFLLKQLSEQSGIDDKTQITFDVADGNNGKINFNGKQLKGFLDTLNVSDNLNTPLQTNDYNKIIQTFLDELRPNKPFMKILNHNNKHYTGMVIENTNNNNFLVSHINSSNGGQLKRVVFNDRKSLENWIVSLIKNGDPTSEFQGKTIINSEPLPQFYNTFFSDRAFKIDSGKITGLPNGNKNDFLPFGQASCTCHQMSVMNLLKYYVEKTEQS